MDGSRAETIAKVEHDLDRMEAIMDEARHAVAAFERVDVAVREAAERRRSLAPLVVIAAVVLAVGTALGVILRRRA